MNLKHSFEILEEEQPRSLFDVVKLVAASGFIAEEAVNSVES